MEMTVVVPDPDRGVLSTSQREIEFLVHMLGQVGYERESRCLDFKSRNRSLDGDLRKTD